MPSKIEESSGVSFSLSFLIQILSAIVLGVWGFSELSNRISSLETVTVNHEEAIYDIETKMSNSQDAPISSDYVQNTSLRFIEEKIAAHQAELELLNRRVYQLRKDIE